MELDRAKAEEKSEYPLFMKQRHEKSDQEFEPTAPKKRRHCLN
jgi:hypothetical protein